MHRPVYLLNDNFVYFSQYTNTDDLKANRHALKVTEICYFMEPNQSWKAQRSSPSQAVLVSPDHWASSVQNFVAGSGYLQKGLPPLAQTISDCLSYALERTRRNRCRLSEPLECRTPSRVTTWGRRRLASAPGSPPCRPCWAPLWACPRCLAMPL